MSYVNGFRYTRVPGVNNKYAIPSKEITNPAYAATIALAPTFEKTTVVFQQLTGDLALSSDVIRPYAADELTLCFQADGSARTVTLGAGFTTNATIVVAASKEATAKFIFSDKSQTWVEVSRFVQS